MVAETWILKMGNQVSANLKQALLLEGPGKKPNSSKKLQEKQVIGILSFEVANVISKTVHLHKSLSDSEIRKLRTEILRSEGVRNLISTDEFKILELVVAEKLDDLGRVAGVVSRLGKKCSEPALQGFEHVYGDMTSGVIDVRELGFLVKDMDGMVAKMERYVSATSTLYNEMEVLAELEQATKKFQNNQHEESRRAYEQKLIWQKQDVRQLMEVSLWNQTYDKVVELLVRTVCTIYARLFMVFGESLVLQRGVGSDQCGIVDSGRIGSSRSVHTVSGQLRRVHSKSSSRFSSGSMEKTAVNRRRSGMNSWLRSDMHRGDVDFFRADDYTFPCVTGPSRIFMDCLSLTSSASRIDDDDEGETIDHHDRSSQTSGCCSVVSGRMKRDPLSHSGFVGHSQVSLSSIGGNRKFKGGVLSGPPFSPKSRLTTNASPSTVGSSALALHYANLIIVIEKLLKHPHMVGEEARDDLYQMLPASLRMSLKTSLKCYAKSLAIYDAPLAHDWKERIDGILKWLAPLAHNMIRWQSERNFEQHQIIARTNVLLLQTLYFADREKTEEFICVLLVGLNYICRYEQQQNALLDCTSSLDFEDCLEWQLQYPASYHG
ncbi:hypothetical protein MLD38_039573 [Melastoma candidum]|uniref:Uncharacterized protein n=1 Tax=Melastoma candidum TaxID=119954 RepID=A0ACB9L2H3_9MYRT|nr:hypothetical protein MLD38_039573 [Melastoma candidum]